MLLFVVLTVYIVSVAFLVGVDRYFDGKVKEERTAPSTAVNLTHLRCNEAGLPHQWEYKLNESGRELLTCKRCNVNPGFN